MRVRLSLVATIAGLVFGLCAVLYPVLPTVFGLGFLLDAGLPWFGLLLPIILVAAFVSRGRAAIASAVASTAVWCAIVVPLALPLAGIAPEPGLPQLVVAGQNVRAGAGTAGESAATLAGTGADVVALQELDAESRHAAAAVLDAQYPFSYGAGTIGVWSAYPIENAVMLDLDLGWKRALSVDLATPSGPVSVYVVHAASVRPGHQAERDEMLESLADTVSRDVNERVVVLGDFNASSTDRALRGIDAVLDEPRQSGGGLGFTWPSSTPMARIDHIFQRGLDTVSNTTLRAGGSDHLAVIATFRL